MSFVNYARREVNYKLVYCGPGLSGKTTNIVQLYRSARPDHRGRLVSLYTQLERTLYFDFLPIDLGRISGFNVRVHMYSVPGQVCYAATRRQVFRGADGIVFVADSNRNRMDANLEAIRDLKENFRFYGVQSRDLPYVLQLNKRDLPDIHEVSYLTEHLRIGSEPVFQAIAGRNQGVQETLKEIVRRILRKQGSDLIEAVI
ncbi:MAG: gliding-motility protein MglA [Acidobacteriota bacterium]|nr:MAG: gliding-motility protein MglA [Acidobacteriota bacterium]